MGTEDLAVPEGAELAHPDHEYRSRMTIGGLPLLHIVRGVDPSTGRRRAAVGVVAIGQVAVGGIAIGQLAVGGITIGQASFGLLGGIGQLTTGLVALGQLAFGAFGAAGQIAVAPFPLGLVPHAGPWAGLVWVGIAAVLGLVMVRRMRRLGPLLRRGALSTVSGLRDGAGRIAGRVVSENSLRAPISNEPCVHWQARRLGPGVHTSEQQGSEILIGDDTGVARIDLANAVTMFQPRAYNELPALDWSVQVESYLAHGDPLIVAGPVRVEPDPEGDASLYRGAPVRAVFRGEPDVPVLITTQAPSEMRAQQRMGLGMAAAFALAGAAVLAPVALGAAAAATAVGVWLSVLMIQE